MFNRICHTVSQTDERSNPLGWGHHRYPRPVQPAAALRDHLAPHWLATAEAL
ncbi:hypothetical protein BKA18_003490 [Streptomyces auratus]